MKCTSAPALIAILLCCSVTICAETVDEMEARLERDRVRIETERKTFNEDCKRVRHEDTAATSACSNRKAIILFEMEHWKFEMARAHNLRCKALAEDTEKWKMGVARAEDVMARNAAMMKSAHEERVADAGNAAQATAKFATSYYFDKSAENISKLTVTKQNIDRALAGGPEFIRRMYPEVTAAQAEIIRKKLESASLRTSALVLSMTEANQELKHATPKEQRRLLARIRDEAIHLRDLAATPAGLEGCGAILSEIYGGPGGKFWFEVVTTAIVAGTSMGGVAVDSKLLYGIEKNQADMQKMLDKAKQRIAEDQLSMQTLGCSSGATKPLTGQ
ncbi:MAG: hypothetical protein CXZ00_03435 [Acidobacteria bacterium]|nr:MAG: hypothetical protein CXZ00_03435 [Acidobacteriota bacterium]